MTNETRKLKTGTLHRAATFERASVDEQARTVELAFSSEAPSPAGSAPKCLT
ncbi:MAG: hypothetical protein IPH64_21540, partial [Comamonadaceae bacterium]|nr:hypothetical protein [Comamonadaceae bacterium]